MNNRVAQLIVVSALLLTGGIAHAQIIGQIEADIPFPFHAGAAKFPAGKYKIRVDDGSDLKTPAWLALRANSALWFPNKIHRTFSPRAVPNIAMTPDEGGGLCLSRCGSITVVEPALKELRSRSNR